MVEQMIAALARLEDGLTAIDSFLRERTLREAIKQAAVFTDGEKEALARLEGAASQSRYPGDAHVFVDRKDLVLIGNAIRRAWGLS